MSKDLSFACQKPFSFFPRRSHIHQSLSFVLSSHACEPFLLLSLYSGLNRARRAPLRAGLSSSLSFSCLFLSPFPSRLITDTNHNGFVSEQEKEKKRKAVIMAKGSSYRKGEVDSFANEVSIRRNKRYLDIALRNCFHGSTFSQQAPQRRPLLSKAISGQLKT